MTVFILEPWFVVSSDPEKDERLGVTQRWGHADWEGGHVRLSREEAAQLRLAIDAWLLE